MENVSIAASRVKRFMHQNGINKAVESHREKLEEVYKKYRDYSEAIETGKEITGHTKDRKTITVALTSAKRKEFQAFTNNKDNKRKYEEYVALKDVRIRFNKNVEDVLAVVLNETLTQLLTFAMDNAVLQNEHKINSLRNHGFENCQLHVLFAGLPTWNRCDDNNNNEEGDDVEDNHSFCTYIAKLFTVLKATDAKYSSLKMSKSLKDFCSNLCVEFVVSVSRSCEFAAEFNNKKTVAEETVKLAIKSLFTLRSSVEDVVSFESRTVTVTENDKNVKRTELHAVKTSRFTDGVYEELEKTVNYFLGKSDERGTLRVAPAVVLPEAAPKLAEAATKKTLLKEAPARKPRATPKNKETTPTKSAAKQTTNTVVNAAAPKKTVKPSPKATTVKTAPAQTVRT